MIPWINLTNLHVEPKTHSKIKSRSIGGRFNISIISDTLDWAEFGWDGDEDGDAFMGVEGGESDEEVNEALLVCCKRNRPGRNARKMERMMPR